MKTLQIRLSDDEHTAIKVEAAKLGLSIKNFVMARVEQFQPEPVSRDITEPQEVRSNVAPAVKEIKGKDYGRFQKGKAK